MNKFAKLFESSEHGQILVTLDMSEPLVSITFDPGIDGVWSTSIKLESKDDDFDKMQHIFDGIDEGKATIMIESAKGKFLERLAAQMDGD